ncbi:RidA family protein [Saccharibacillus sp. JS10]|uniref:RidA family protein n=1 Tax=Saccharibacillus sp. JS10 TaxID=2950552 RepID=UPI00210EC87C|nr:RidA family protein [Saccharibacillus sp. JS10]MCQ4087377.1 RidA family protein [Saccharibacillus sp. JS10]
MTSNKKTIVTDKAPGAIGPYSQAVSANGFIFASGQLGIDPATGEFPAGGVEEQAKQSLENVRALLESAGSGLDRVVKATMFLKDMNDFAAANAVYGTFFSEPFPARSTIEVARLPKDALVEVEVIALAE